MKYYLSNRQLKELDRGNALHIAIPCPPFQIDPEEYVKSILVVNPKWIFKVEELEKYIDPFCRDGGELQKAFGTILKEGFDAKDHPITLQVSCFIVLLSQREKPNSAYPDNWPGSLK